MIFSQALQNVFKKRAFIQSAKILQVSNEKYAVYFGVNASGKPTASYYQGRSLKADSYYFQSEEKRKNSTEIFIQNCEERHQRKAKEKTESMARILQVGDVLYSSWGCEQTNIDFYLVVELVGKASVKIVEIAGIKKDKENMSGLVIPNLDERKGELMTKRVRNGNVVKIESYCSATPAEYEVIAGCRIYKGYRFSTYA